MAITRSMAVPISARKEKYVKELRVLMTTAHNANNYSTPITERRIVMIKVFKFLNTNGLRIFGFSGSEGKFIKTIMVKVDSFLMELSEEIAQGAVSKRVLILDKKLLGLLETCKQMVTDHKTGVLMALNAHFPQDIVREIAENYV
jgi:hypothetical protein